jgi:hypothetical protein
MMGEMTKHHLDFLVPLNDPRPALSVGLSMDQPDDLTRRSAG